MNSQGPKTEGCAGSSVQPIVLRSEKEPQ
jgi:hypothetical protein